MTLTESASRRVPIKEPVTQCRQCRGTGIEANSKLPCLTCRGKGVVQVKG